MDEPTLKEERWWLDETLEYNKTSTNELTLDAKVFSSVPPSLLRVWLIALLSPTHWTSDTLASFTSDMLIMALHSMARKFRHRHLWSQEPSRGGKQAILKLLPLHAHTARLASWRGWLPCWATTGDATSVPEGGQVVRTHPALPQVGSLRTNNYENINRIGRSFRTPWKYRMYKLRAQKKNSMPKEQKYFQ